MSTELTTTAVYPRPARWVVDASVWVSRFLAGDVHHVASRAWLDHHFRRGHRVIAPTILLSEVAGALVRRTNDVQRTALALRAIRRLQGLQWVAVTARTRDDAAYLATTLRLRGADAIYVAVAARLRLPLVTWDSEQLTRARSVITTMTP